MKGFARVNPDVVRRAAEHMKARAAKAWPYRVSVGLHAEDAQSPALDYNGIEGKLRLIEVAAMLEMGTDSMPERSFLRSWFDQNISRMKREAVTAMRDEFKSGSKGAVDEIAQRWSNELQDWIRSGAANLTPLASSTVRRREQAGLSPDVPLDARGQLVAAIRSLVEEA